jgi:hypothetical protein
MPIRLGTCLVVISSLWFGRSAFADLTPEMVLLVVNRDSSSSLAVANEYVRLRQIPDINIVSLTGITNVEQLSVNEFRQQILAPVLKTIDDRKLRSQIRCVVYSTDLPTAIHVGSDVDSRKLPQIFTPVASINGLTFLYQFTMTKDIRYLDLNVNSYARRFGAKSADTPWKPDELQLYANALQRLQLQAPRARSSDREIPPVDALLPANDPGLSDAIDTLQRLTQAHPQSAELHYNLACALATLDQSEAALATLKRAVAVGWFDHQHASRDPDFHSVRDLPEFKSLLGEMKAVKLDVLPARGFRPELGWQANGEPAIHLNLPRYMLSTVLGVTVGRGTKVSEVVTGLQRSAAADGTHPPGTVYFVRNGDVRSTTREWGFASAAARLKEMGVNAVIEEGVLPQKKSDVAGAMIGIADFDWDKSESQIVPGAIVEHLTSFGGVMTRGAGQTPLTEFLRHGAAGASGTVTEPYAIQAKFPNPFIHVHYASGCTLAEAFYSSVTGPYQLLIVGDPLCNPWRRELHVTAELPSTDAPLSGSVTFHPKCESKGGVAASKVHLFVDGLRRSSVKPGTPIELDTRELSDGLHQFTFVVEGNDSIETNGRWSAQCQIRNEETSPPKLVILNGTDHDFGGTVEIEVRCPGAMEIGIQHLGREVATVSGESGTAKLEARGLGSGTTMLRAIARFPGGKSVRGDGLTMTIRPPLE